MTGLRNTASAHKDDAFIKQIANNCFIIKTKLPFNKSELLKGDLRVSSSVNCCLRFIDSNSSMIGSIRLVIAELMETQHHSLQTVPHITLKSKQTTVKTV